MVEYYQKMETLMERTKIWEEEKDTMSRFLGGLNREIAHSVDRSSHIYLEDIYHYPIKIWRKKRGTKGEWKSRGTKEWFWEKKNVNLGIRKGEVRDLFSNEAQTLYLCAKECV